MPVTIVSWSNGDTVTESKLDSMVQNDILLQNKTDNVILSQAPKFIGTTSGNADVWLYVAGSSIGASFSASATEEAQENLDISGLTDETIYELELRSSLGAHMPGAPVFRFLKGPDTNMITFWCLYSDRDNSGSPVIHTIDYLTVIAHRTTKAWI